MTRAKRLPIGPEGFWAKVEPTGFCWEWLAFKDKNGYGRYKNNVTSPLAHRYSYQLLIGPIPDGLVLDHLCRNPSCVNPDHLEPVEFTENLRRAPNHMSKRTHCSLGHAFSKENTYYNKKGHRYCKRCNALGPKRRKALREELVK